jgi:hypothetical protein
MPLVGFEPMNPAFERVTVHALDRAATVIGSIYMYLFLIIIVLSKKIVLSRDCGIITVAKDGKYYNRSYVMWVPCVCLIKLITFVTNRARDRIRLE